MKERSQTLYKDWVLKKLTIPHVDEGEEQVETSHIFIKNVKWCTYFASLIIL